MDFKRVYDNLCKNCRKVRTDKDFTPELYEAYRVGVCDTVKALGLWGQYGEWAKENNIPDDEED